MGGLDSDAWKARSKAELDEGDAVKKQWNTSELGRRVGSDALAALSAGGLVAPIITMIDRGIIENASGRNTLAGSIRASLWRLAFRPHHFIFSKPFALVFTLYTGTYLSANLTDTVSATITSSHPATTTAGPTKFLTTSSTNLALCLYKDSKFTQMFGRASTPSKICLPPSPVRLPTYALFTLRDALTIFASFNVPPLLAPVLPLHALGDAVERNVSAMGAAQFIAPAGMQIFSTPLHLLGLDLYNRPGASWRERAGKIAREYGMSTLARMGRIIPAFGVGGVVNRGVRENLMGRLDA